MAIVEVTYLSGNVYVDYDYRGEPNPSCLEVTKESVHLYKVVQPQLAPRNKTLCSCLRCEVKRTRLNLRRENET